MLCIVVIGGMGSMAGVLSLAHRAYVLETGRLVLEGVASDLAGDPRVIAANLGGS